MLLIDASNAEDYLRQTGRIAPDEIVRVRELAGGVSNVVLLVSHATGEPRFVLKQVREQLRVPEPWFCSIERIWREVDVLEVCHRALADTAAVGLQPGEPAIAVPRVLFTDRDNYLFAMSAAPNHEVWKAQLLRGEICLATAAACGRILGTIHAATWQQSDVVQRLGDSSFFDALRLDPYYRHVARSQADVAPALQRLIASLAEHARCLVHGDFSPKNILVHPGGLTLVDFEVGHFGDPAFDLGFFLTHLVLKAIRAREGWWDFFQLTFAFWNQYKRNLLPTCGPEEYAALGGRGIQNLAGCLLARVDGKSRVEYLDSSVQATVRGFARDLLFHSPATWPAVVARFVNRIVEPAESAAPCRNETGSLLVSNIRSIHAREILDSRGKPTVEVEIHNTDGSLGRASVPSGASTGSAEALELRDLDAARYDGEGVHKSIGIIVKTLAPAILGLDAADQAAVDARLLALDPSPQKKTLGGNSLLAVSLAAAHAGAAAQRKPLFRHFHQLYLDSGTKKGADPNGTAIPNSARVAIAPRMPMPMTNMISGGLHAGGNLDIQDVLVLPIGAPDYATGLEWIVRVYRRLGVLLQQQGYEGRLVGDEGGYGPRLGSNVEAIRLVVQAIEAANLSPGQDMTIALDVAASHFFDNGVYRLASDGGRQLDSAQMVELLAEWVGEFPIASIEDGLAENDWSGWRLLTDRLGHQVQLVGDDLFTTSATRVRRGIELGVANSVLIKVNQIGTLTETLHTIHTARAAGYSLVVSARSGETEDSTIADLAVGVAAEQIKIGSIVRSERLAKYNQLLRIQEQLPAPSH